MKSFRKFAIGFGIFLVALPFAIALAMSAEGETSAFIFFTFLAATAVIAGISTGSRRGIYWALFPAIWFLSFSLLIVSHFFPPILFIPLGLSIILAANYRKFVGKSTHSRPTPPPQWMYPPHPQGQNIHISVYTPQPYQQGYQPAPPVPPAQQAQPERPAYQEEGTSHTYSSSMHYEQPLVQYPPDMS